MKQGHPAKLLLRRWPSIVVMTVIGLVLAGAYLASASPLYTAHADILISPPVAQSTRAVSDRTVESYAQVLGGRGTAGRVVQDLGLPMSGRSVDLRLDGEVVPGTSTLRATAEDGSRERAAEIGQSAAETFVTWFGTLDTDLTATVVEKAAVPTTASSPSRAGWLTAGGILGLLAGLLLTWARKASDHSIRTPAELEEISEAPVLGAIAYDRAAVDSPLITSLGTHHPRFEAIRILRTNLQFLDIDRDTKVITITSSLAGEGKSTTACNLAIALSQTGSRVALVEGDLRRPRVSEYLGIEKAVGLTTVLVGRVTLDAALQPAATPGLDVLTSGSLPPNPSEILQTNAMRALVSDLRHRYDIVLIDAPPLLPVTDASLLASISDGAILVVRHGQTSRDEVRTATERLHSVGARLLGTVLSMSPVKELSRYGYGYGYGYGPDYFAQATGGRRGGARRS
ncbi:capsular biosynthesis protein [Aeromicrobium sp. A1-2]|uniref:polysaccharide biosynthesis tyrosine autokinase n=1 Tax=Aeromicrobium sp. A1-2 TaxID=2107713 RepID=UPI000E4BD2FA|nr:polysaccharide biosynthesis tyrosine autokinase [Aeromicrobium sp. A1-2]AXT86062.1 capsular biosynthesis protein [Aeromicrobium sp. A1-2]